MRKRLHDVLSRPAPEGATGPTRRDAWLVAVLVAAATLESALRTDLAWPVATALVTTVLLATLPWRRSRPLAVVTVTMVVSAGFELAQAAEGATPEGLGTMFAVLLVPYALFRWGSGRDRLVGGGILAAGVALSVALGGEGIEGAIAGILFVGGACLVGAFRVERARSRARELDAVRAAEREALARDLHDTVAHHVSAIAIRAQAAATSPGDATRVAESLAVIEREARAVLTDMRSLVRTLRAPASLGPSSGLAELAALAGSGPPAVTVRLEAPEGVPDIVASTLFRITQEAVTNARRHARSVTRIDVTVTVDADLAHVTVRDDGADPRTASGDGHGLRGIAERAALLGGDVTAGPDPEGGWTVDATLPVRSGA